MAPVSDKSSGVDAVGFLRRRFFGATATIPARRNASCSAVPKAASKDCWRSPAAFPRLVWSWTKRDAAAGHQLQAPERAHLGDVLRDGALFQMASPNLQLFERREVLEEHGAVRGGIADHDLHAAQGRGHLDALWELTQATAQVDVFESGELPQPWPQRRCILVPVDLESDDISRRSEGIGERSVVAHSGEHRPPGTVASA